MQWNYRKRTGFSVLPGSCSCSKYIFSFLTSTPFSESFSFLPDCEERLWPDSKSSIISFSLPGWRSSQSSLISSSPSWLSELITLPCASNLGYHSTVSSNTTSLDNNTEWVSSFSDSQVACKTSLSVSNEQSHSATKTSFPYSTLICCVPALCPKITKMDQNWSRSFLQLVKGFINRYCTTSHFGNHVGGSWTGHFPQTLALFLCWSIYPTKSSIADIYDWLLHFHVYNTQ